MLLCPPPPGHAQARSWTRFHTDRTFPRRFLRHGAPGTSTLDRPPPFGHRPRAIRRDWSHESDRRVPSPPFPRGTERERERIPVPVPGWLSRKAMPRGEGVGGLRVTAGRRLLCGGGGGGNASRRGGHLEPRTRTRLNAQPSPGFDREGLLGLPNKVPLEGRVAAGKPPWLPLLRGPCVRPSLTKKRPPACALPSPRRRTAASPPGDAFSGAEPGREASFLMARSFQEDTGGRRKEDRKRENTCGFGSHTRACDVRTRKKGSTRLGDSTLSRSSAGQETDLGSTEIHGGLPRGSTPPTSPQAPPPPDPQLAHLPRIPARAGSQVLPGLVAGGSRSSELGPRAIRG